MESHSHHHNHAETLIRVNTAFVVGIVLNLLFVLIEAGVGIYVNSLSLLSDAGHNLADVASLALSLLAFKLLKVKPNAHYTYGYKKTSILVALLNSLLLALSIGAIVYEAVHRLFFDPEVLPGKAIAITAGVGIVINSITAWMFASNKDKDINVKSAYLHLLADAVVSLGIVIGGIVIFYTHWYWLDAVLSIIIAVVIMIGTWSLLKQSLRLSLDGVPDDIHISEVKEAASKISGIKSVHHIHVWAISSSENALTAHLVLNGNITLEQEFEIKGQLKHSLEHMNITHVTLETEREYQSCETKEC
ncbi:MAG: ybgR [Sphingobacteriaceae bacterium]|jgi:cobalt-zinc-cadmium efflux system protein|nr:ybgR [Sphingobacteriaceae bacterium]